MKSSITTPTIQDIVTYLTVRFGFETIQNLLQYCTSTGAKPSRLGMSPNTPRCCGFPSPDILTKITNNNRKPTLTGMPDVYSLACPEARQNIDDPSLRGSKDHTKTSLFP